MSEEMERCVAFIRQMEERQAEKSVRTEHGVVHLSPTLPRVWYLNFLSVDIGVSPTADELAAEAEAIQAPAGLRHRKIGVNDELGARLTGGFRYLGWKVEELLVMVHRGGGKAVKPPDTIEVDAETLSPVWAKGIAEEHPDPETIRQLVAAQLGRREAVSVRYFAMRAGAHVVAYCELFSRDGIGQVESVMTLKDFRRRGFGRAVVARALEESIDAGHDITFLLADAEDWPKELYRKLGFEEVGRVWDFIREPQRGGLSEPSSAQP